MLNARPPPPPPGLNEGSVAPGLWDEDELAVFFFFHRTIFPSLRDLTAWSWIYLRKWPNFAQYGGGIQAQSVN